MLPAPPALHAAAGCGRTLWLPSGPSLSPREVSASHQGDGCGRDLSLVAGLGRAWLCPLGCRAVSQGICPWGVFHHRGGHSQGGGRGSGGDGGAGLVASFLGQGWQQGAAALRAVPCCLPHSCYRISLPATCAGSSSVLCELPVPAFWGSPHWVPVPCPSTHLADGVEGSHMLEPAVRQPIGDLSAVQQPLAPAEVPVFAQHPAVGTGWGGTGWDGTGRVRSSRVGRWHPAAGAGEGVAGASLTSRL